MAIFERTKNSLGKLGDSSKGLVENVKEAFTQTFSSAKGKSVVVGGYLGNTADRIGSAAVWTVRQPVRVASGIFGRFPVLAPVATVAAGAMIVGDMLHKRTERRAMNEYGQMEAAMQQQAAMAQAQANTVTPAEYAAMEARMKQGGQNGGFAAGLQADRAQAAAGPAV